MMNPYLIWMKVFVYQPNLLVHEVNCFRVNKWLQCQSSEYQGIWLLSIMSKLKYWRTLSGQTLAMLTAVLRSPFTLIIET